MDYLWTPWRFQYVSDPRKSDVCVFCEKAAGDRSTDRENLILYRGQFNFVLLNLYPYTTGHAMIAPYAHVADLFEVQTDTVNEMMALAQRVQRALRDCYHPQGYNLGLNIGRCAGAGVEHHIHLHALPRWTGDSNFMTVVGETRVEPQELSTTYDKLIGYFRD
ncbi:MAG TPA: HIT domain-containing protein [Terriglobia bacterium]|nr:HIT domain-containing protein [Terriglobia bacterium]